MTFEEQVSSIVQNIGWVKGEDYRHNYGQSIGANSTTKVFDLNKREIYGNTTFKFKEQSPYYDGSKNGENGIPLMIAGNLSVDHAIQLGNTTLSVSNDRLTVKDNSTGNELNFYPSSIRYASELTPEQAKRAQRAAVKEDIDRVENKIEINRQQMIAFLEIIKYVPELASKRESINDLIRSLEESAATEEN